MEGFFTVSLSRFSGRFKSITFKSKVADHQVNVLYCSSTVHSERVKSGGARRRLNLKRGTELVRSFTCYGVALSWSILGQGVITIWASHHWRQWRQKWFQWRSPLASMTITIGDQWRHLNGSIGAISWQCEGWGIQWKLMAPMVTNGDNGAH